MVNKCKCKWLKKTPGETPETIKETVDFIKSVGLFVPAIFVTNPYPGSEFYDYAKEKGLIKDEGQFVLRCGAALDLNVNLTDTSDAGLLRLQRWAMQEVVSYYRKKHSWKR
ncbi:MAG: hypothetical protein NTW59_04745 [Candidatus Diapherotrites archaeon]|nr:hypothetical protein [Candidatus Diapherotrites archaeon]